MTTTQEKIKEIERELNMRKKHFPTWILKGRIKEEVANKRIKIMEEILADYKEKAKEEDKQGILL